MALVVAWSLFVLGIAHVVFGLVKYREPWRAAVGAGLVGKFASSDVRRVAFWFTLLGVPMMLAGHVAVHAVHTGDVELQQIVGVYVAVTSLLGVIAFPKSPFWAPLLLAPLLVVLAR